ncbi:PREDICTED: BEL1-like homeodomain protein 1 [Nelumbo nucifera]|uniref:BEL1-like homeodomain protein 1 n=1 Tax=Nelumbo nucifera TaxID=4432 RepID=A0A1U7Z8A8_NELNU|nr:PREDICTED: BEL1-like homeodomain protein 1 [Nelumbo nucifera]XP_010247219.1 PREDICTED: BEL1-like homeodomain protein 1 [Nelumbo nucifera]XP_010247233.1 PREDICTED: BEL1-like homeodomain protein 1 [Nelumbo nucifera]XP_019051997.1 PREDICTED: BEL1-like homeodomain protein 1 [Nelumbo nucifera]
MATYFHGTSEIQADGLQTLYLMNPGYVGYTDTQPPSNMVFLNSTGNTLNPASLVNAPQQNQHLVGIPLQAAAVPPGSAAAAAQDPNRPSVHNQQEMSAVHGFVPRVHYNLWTSTQAHHHHHHQISTSAAAAAAVNNSIGVDVSSPLGLRRSVVPLAQQGLSLSLSSQQPTYGSYRQESDLPASAPAPVISPTSNNEMRISGGSSSSASAVSSGISGMQSVILGSKYLKAAQQLLDEVVNVGKGIKAESAKGVKGSSKISRDPNASTGEASTGGENSTKQAAELTTAERQELQMKKAKLINMLDEVEQRYRQYHHQMQIVVSAFEQAAGFGSAKTYTALALQTISKQFRCLKDAISGQIRATSKSLGEEDCFGGKTEGSRLRFVDQQLRQQRALQQLGMIQHNAWRPQRGLPERSVSVLRAWLFEHFLHPYPKDSDKHMLAKQTGLTRSQVSNWFINARVRLWKPMVEEMYLEEIKEQEQNGSEEKTSRSELNEDSGSKSTAPHENSPARTDQGKNFSSKQDNSTNPNAVPTAISNSSTTAIMGGIMRSQTGFSLIGSSDMDGLIQGSPKKPCSTEMQNSPSSISVMDMDVKPGDSNRDLFAKFQNGRQSRDGYSLITGTTNNGEAFDTYSIGELGRFDPEQFTPRFSGNGVSLTLGLPHCENLSLSGTQQTFLSNQNIQLGRRLEMGGGEPNDFCGLSTPSPHSSAAYENINIQNRKRFAAQLLPDYVA